MKTLGLILAVLMCVAWAPPSGRPPIGPLERYEPRAYELTFTVGATTLQQVNGMDKQSYILKEAPIVFPIAFLGSFSKVESDSVKAKLWLGDREVNPNLLLKDGYPFSTHLATMTVKEFTGQSVKWQIKYNTQSWSSRIDDEKAARIPWPKTWPKEVLDGLQRQMYIESNDPTFEQTVQRISKGQLRMVTPYLAAKDIVRYCINEIQVSGSANISDEFNVLRGMNINGALYAAKEGKGTPHDLVCVCVAMLRAAGIPARPVIGADEDEKRKGVFVSWAEFYLPEVGWIPFDPYVMRGKGIRSLDVRKPWPEFGTMDDVNRRVTLAYHFLPSATIESPRNPAVWGWDPRPGGDTGSDQRVYIDITSRGKGVEDPQ